MVRMLLQVQSARPIADGLLALQLTGSPLSALIALVGPTLLRLLRSHRTGAPTTAAFFPAAPSRAAL